jgi:hypothetical protein
VTASAARTDREADRVERERDDPVGIAAAARGRGRHGRELDGERGIVSRTWDF